MSSVVAFLLMPQPGGRGSAYCQDHSQVPWRHHLSTSCCFGGCKSSSEFLGHCPLFLFSPPQQEEPSPDFQSCTAKASACCAIEAPCAILLTRSGGALPLLQCCGQENRQSQHRLRPLRQTLGGCLSTPWKPVFPAKTDVNVNPTNTEEEGGTPLEGPRSYVNNYMTPKHNHNT